MDVFVNFYRRPVRDCQSSFPLTPELKMFNNPALIAEYTQGPRDTGENSRRQRMVSLTLAAREKLTQLHEGKQIKPIRIVQEVS